MFAWFIHLPKIYKNEYKNKDKTLSLGILEAWPQSRIISSPDLMSLPYIWIKTNEDTNVWISKWVKEFKWIKRTMGGKKGNGPFETHPSSTK